jgi:hypothetical protein
MENQMAQADAQVIQFPIKQKRQAKQKRQKSQSQYELYPLPFFNADARCTWDVKPTGNYTVDCETGHAYAVAFLQTADGTYGWNTLLGCIVADMIRAGTNGASADGHPKVNGVVVGFMAHIGRLLNAIEMYAKDDPLVSG